MARSSAARRTSASRAPASKQTPAPGPRATKPARKSASSVKTLKETKPAKKAAPKKAAPKKAPAKPAAKSTAKKATAKKTVTKRVAAKPAVAKKAAPKKAAAKKAAPKKRIRMAARATTTNTKAATAKVATVKASTARLSEAELTGIWKTYKRTRDENLRNILIEHHMPLVKMIAERLLQTLPKSIELDDLTSAGTFGLMDAINGFDLTRGIKFKTYCTTRIRGSILDELRSQDWVPASRPPQGAPPREEPAQAGR